MKLSLCIAVFNEEKNIHYPLDSCIDWVDEVIIVDGGSTDKTVEVAKSYGKKVKIFHRDNPALFLINRQRALDQAKGDWILQLDADEEVGQNLKDEILSVISGRMSDVRNEPITDNRKLNTTPVAYWIPRRNFFLGRFLMKGGVYPDRVLRLYRNGCAKFLSAHVHEHAVIDPSVIFPNLKKGEYRVEDYIGVLNKDLLHYADPYFGRYIMRWRRYNNVDAKLLNDQKKKAGFFNYCIWKPLYTFVLIYGRHKGFMDGWQGFVFAFFSSIRFIDIYKKSRELSEKSETTTQNIKIF